MPWQIYLSAGTEKAHPFGLLVQSDLLLMDELCLIPSEPAETDEIYDGCPGAAQLVLQSGYLHAVVILPPMAGSEGVAIVQQALLESL